MKQIEKELEKGKKNSSFFETLNPINNSYNTFEKIIRFTIIIFSGVSIYRIFKSFDLIKYVLFNKSEKLDLDFFLYLLPLVLLPLSIFLLWRRKKIGWILTSAFFTYSTVSLFWLFILNLKINQSTLTQVNNILPVVQPFTYLFNSLFFGAFLFLICKKVVRIQFNVNNKIMFIIIGIITFSLIYKYLQIVIEYKLI